MKCIQAFNLWTIAPYFSPIQCSPSIKETTQLRLRVIADTATINISDHGYGIPEDELHHIFEPFFRSAEPHLAQNRGAGLALRFLKTVVKRHGGDISVTSQWGQGTNFQIRIPLSS
jgi:two-component system sensor histidine kinase SenX3